MSKNLRKLMVFVALALFLGGCSLPSSIEGKNSVWIDVPVNGIHVPEGAALPVEGHAYSADGVSKVEIWINGERRFEVHDLASTDKLYTFSQPWTPPAAGEYTIQVVAFDSRGNTSDADSVRVWVGEATALPATVTATSLPPTPTADEPTPTPTLTPPPTPAPVIKFWAEPATIDAGATFTIYWHVEHVQKVVFGGAEQAFDGSYTTSVCKDTRYPLTVTHLDGSEEQRTVEIHVNGSCVTPTPTPTITPTPTTPPDTTPPPAPTPAVPADGLTLSCRATQTLAWLPVDDPSGISGYEVQLEYEVTPGKWQIVSNYGPVSNKQVDVNVDCGIRYRWRVRARDRAGNYSPWSAYATFNINLD